MGEPPGSWGKRVSAGRELQPHPWGVVECHGNGGMLRGCCGVEPWLSTVQRGLQTGGGTGLSTHLLNPMGQQCFGFLELAFWLRVNAKVSFPQRDMWVDSEQMPTDLTDLS